MEPEAVTVSYRSPRDEPELDDCVQCVARAFGGSLPFFTAIVREDPWFRLENTRACFVGGRAVSVVQVFDRPVRFGASVLRMGGLGSVGTDPEHRRSGYSLGALRDTVRFMRDEGYDLSVLFTGIPSHYGRAGWVVHPVHHLRLNLPETLSEPRGIVSTEACDLGRDLPELMPLYDRSNATRTGTLVRTEAYWRRQPRWREIDPALFRVARRDGRIVAYLKTARWSLQEMAWLPGEEEAMRELGLGFLRQAGSEGARDLDAFCPSEFRGILESWGCRVQRREASYTMVQVVNLSSLLTKIGPALEARLRNSRFAGWEGRLAIRYEGAQAMLRVAGRRITVVEPGPDPAIDLRVSQTQLLGLLFGNLKGSDIAFANGWRLGEPEIGLIDALFPAEELFMWRPDGF